MASLRLSTVCVTQFSREMHWCFFENKLHLGVIWCFFDDKLHSVLFRANINARYLPSHVVKYFFLCRNGNILLSFHVYTFKCELNLVAIFHAHTGLGKIMVHYIPSQLQQRRMHTSM